MNLLILDCNAGAMVGNYRLGNLWHKVDRFRQPDWKLAAIDCIPLVHHLPGGTLVGEWEMERVKGYSAYPSQVQWKHSRIQSMSDRVAQSLLELKPKRIIAYVAKTNYIISLHVGLKKAGMRDLATLWVLPPAPQIVMGNAHKAFFARGYAERMPFDAVRYCQNRPHPQMLLHGWLKRVKELPPDFKWWDAQNAPYQWVRP